MTAPTPRLLCWLGRHDRRYTQEGTYGRMWQCRRCRADGVEWSYYFTERYG